MKSAALAWGLLGLVLASSAQARDVRIELLGFGEQGASLRYVSGPEVTVRYRIRGPAGEPMNVLLRRDDGATTVLANVAADGALRTATVPVKAERWTLSEYELFAFEPASGTMHRAPRPMGIVQTGPDGDAATALQRTRARLEKSDGFDADLVAGHDLDGLSGALE